ncbi:MAG: glycosyltransferase [Runella sp.]
MKSTTRTIIYDRDVSGHHLDYLQFLVEYVKKSPDYIREKFIFALSYQARQRFEEAEQEVRFHYIDADKLHKLEQMQSVLKRAAAEMKYVVDLANQYKAERVVLMHLDAFQYELGAADARHLHLKFSGLLFLPFRKYYEDGSTFKAILKRELRGWRKNLQIQWMLQNKNLEKIFFLNDKQGVEEYNQRFDNRFFYLPDPIATEPFSTAPLPELKLKYQVANDRFVFLIYGHLSERKNIPHILAALSHIPLEMHSKICLLICGEPEKGYEAPLKEMIEKAEEKYSEIAFVKHFHFFDPICTNEVFKLTDAVLVPYINFFSSSNILGLAAKYGKPLVASNLGVMGFLVNQYQLGYTVSPDSPKDIAAAMKTLFENPTSLSIDGSSYLQDHAADSFCEKLLF